MTAISSSWSPDWRQIGKKLRDIIYPPEGDTGPSKKARLQQRRLDAQRGFAYFDDFDELDSWTPRDVNASQIANTPLNRRPAQGAARNEETGSGAKTRVLLCHDYKGGYHDYEGVRPAMVENALYSCTYLDYVDTFVYFSHKLVCVPPPTWTNTLHRNGVKSLGTFLVEPQTPGVLRMLGTVDGKYSVAQQLAAMAVTFGFDGWLLNMEKEFPDNTHNVVGRMTDFIGTLRGAMGQERLVIWYDALTAGNAVQFQNGLTAKNLPFAKASDGLFTNYRWTLASLREAQNYGSKNGLEPADIYFGVDVWAQNTDSPTHSRVTYPVKGGGGTNTGLAAAVLAEKGFSTAIFAPGWTYEHFSIDQFEEKRETQGHSIARSVDRSMWEGTVLPTKLHGCDCKRGNPHHTVEYKTHPIIGSAYRFPSGSSTFFESSFMGAFVEEDVIDQDGYRVRPVLGAQQPMPNLLPISIDQQEEMPDDHSRPFVYAKLGTRRFQGLQVFVKRVGKVSDTAEGEATRTAHLTLFEFNMPADGTLAASISYRLDRTSRSLETGVFATYAYPGQVGELKNELREHKCQHENSTETSFPLQCGQDDACFVGLGVYCRGYKGAAGAQRLLEVQNIVIKPPNQRPTGFDITDIRIEERREMDDSQQHLAWNWRGSQQGWPDGMPWSRTTGPFSFFRVAIDQRIIGEAYCLEIPLYREDLGSGGEDEVKICVTGIIFGGGEVCSFGSFPGSAPGSFSKL